VKELEEGGVNMNRRLPDKNQKELTFIMNSNLNMKNDIVLRYLNQWIKLIKPSQLNSVFPIKFQNGRVLNLYVSLRLRTFKEAADKF